MTNLQRGKRARFFRVIFVLVLLVGGFTLPAHAQGEIPDNLPDLLTPVDELAPMGITMDSTGEVIRNRWIAVNTDLLMQIARSGGQQIGDGQPDFAFNLFVDVTYPAYVRGVEEMFNGAVGLYGVLSNNPVSEFVLVVQNGIVHGYLQDGIDTYEIRYQDGGQVVVEVDSSMYPDSLPPLSAPAGTTSSTVVQADQAVAQDTGLVIDVLGVYTPRAKDTDGGVNAIVTRIEASIVSANLGYANSGVTQRLRLVGVEEVNYDEILPGASDLEMWYYALDRLTFGRYGTDLPQANYLSDARSYRDAYGADLVFMVTDLPYAACGLGYMAGDPGDSEIGYSVVHLNCTGNSAYSVQHELGHNMGACHNRANAGDTRFCYSGVYSFGYWLDNGLYNTVMAYYCSTCVARINYWSNPFVSYEGYPTGVDLGGEFPAYNTLTLNNTAADVANYRQAVTIQARFVPAGAYDRLQYPRTRLDVEASSSSGDIIQVMYRAYYDGVWHTIKIDSNPADGWAYTWNSAPVGERTITLQAYVWDSANNSRAVELNNVTLGLGGSTSAGYTARDAERGERDTDLGLESAVLQPDTGGVLGREPIPLDAAEVEEMIAQHSIPLVKLPPVKYLSLLE